MRNKERAKVLDLPVFYYNSPAMRVANEGNSKTLSQKGQKVAVPPAFSLFISMLKDSSLVSVMGLWEIMFLSQSYGRSAYRYMEMLLSAALIYWLLSIVLELCQHRLEHKLAAGQRPAR